MIQLYIKQLYIQIKLKLLNIRMNLLAKRIYRLQEQYFKENNIDAKD